MIFKICVRKNYIFEVVNQENNVHPRGTFMREAQICKQIILLTQIDSQWVVHESEFNISMDWIMVHFGLFNKQSFHTALEDICNTSIVLSNPFFKL